MDITPKEVASLDVQASQLDVVMVQHGKVDKERSPIVFYESHCIGVHLLKETTPWSNVSIDESLSIDQIVRVMSIDEWLLNFL